MSLVSFMIGIGTLCTTTKVPIPMFDSFTSPYVYILLTDFLPNTILCCPNLTQQESQVFKIFQDRDRYFVHHHQNPNHMSQWACGCSKSPSHVSMGLQPLTIPITCLNGLAAAYNPHHMSQWACCRSQSPSHIFYDRDRYLSLCFIFLQVHMFTLS